MEYDILLTKQPANGYLARPVLMPELVVSGKDEDEALMRVREAISNATEESRIVRIEVPESEKSLQDPWLRFAGRWGDDTEWAQFQENIEQFRNEVDERTRPPDE